MLSFHIVDFAALIQFISMTLFALLTMWAGIVSESINASRLVEIIFSGLLESIFCYLERFGLCATPFSVIMLCYVVIHLTGESRY